MFRKLSWTLFIILLVCNYAQADTAIVVHPSNTNLLGARQIERIFLGNEMTFPDGSKAVPINQEDDTLAAANFNLQVLGKTSSQVKSYWSSLVFSGRKRAPKEVAGDEEVIRLVTENTNMIGYISADNPAESVRVLDIYPLVLENNARGYCPQPLTTTQSDSPDLCTQQEIENLFTRLKCDIEYVSNVNKKRSLFWLENGKIDFSIGISVSQSQRMDNYFSEPYQLEEYVLITKKQNTQLASVPRWCAPALKQSYLIIEENDYISSDFQASAQFCTRGIIYSSEPNEGYFRSLEMLKRDRGDALIVPKSWLNKVQTAQPQLLSDIQQTAVQFSPAPVRMGFAKSARSKKIIDLLNLEIEKYKTAPLAECVAVN